MKYQLFDRVVLNFELGDYLVGSSSKLTSHELIGTLLSLYDNSTNWVVLLPKRTAICEKMSSQNVIDFKIDSSYIGKYYKIISEFYFVKLASKQKCLQCKKR